MLKLPVEGGVITLKISSIVPLECAMVSRPKGNLPTTKQIVVERIKVEINQEYSEQTIMIGSILIEEGRNKLCDLLSRNLDIFTWKPADMNGVPRHIAKHHLNVREGCSPVRQKKRGQATDRNQVIHEEVRKLVEVGIIKEVYYHDWLSNSVMVKKLDDSWRMCVDFKDLNKACPKDGYPRPEIDWKVKSLCGFPFKCFLDAYKGYNQKQMAKEDEEKTTFITSQGIFCYTKRPFGLRNAEATYQRLVDKAFYKQIGKNLEVYVDDLVIKSRTEDEIVRDIEETFKTLREINMKLNPKKCTFRVEEWMFLGYKVNTRELKLIAELPMLVTPMEKEELIVYLAASKEMRITEQIGVKNLQANVDSRLVANQVNETYVAKEADMIRYLVKVRTLTSSFKAFSIRQVPRSENKKADALSKIASTSFAHLSKQVLVEELKENSISKVEILAVVEEEEGDTWMTPIFKYPTKETLPADVKKARAVRGKSRRFAVINGTLYQKSFLGPWLWCVRPLQANYVLGEIHEGSCSMHAGTRSIMAKALRISYYWPTMHKDARKLIRVCQDCQVHKPVPRNPEQKLTPITSPWPIDYFTKWIEAKPVATITGNQIKKFVWDNIVCRFGLPGEIISDNGKQFWDNLFKDCLGEGIKARLDARSKNWMEELSYVLWAHRTMIKSSNEDTLFSLTYETKVVIPPEIGMPILRTAEVDLVQNNEAL
ncbi:reverse transcriptase domain-containing protein [Tanacetum coccineum]